MARAGRVRVSDRFLRLHKASGTVEVRFDGQRVWAVGPEAGTHQAGGWWRVPWPPGLRRYLEGSTLVTVVETGSGEVVGAVEHRFGTATDRVEATDEQGRPVFVGKWGHATSAFDSLDPRERRRWLDTLERLLVALRDDCGLECFVSYGTLLGAVRSGGFIGHDVDADVSYVSRFEHPLDVVRESLRVERDLRAGEWRVRRVSGAFLQVLHRDAVGRWRNLDIFTTFFLGDMLYQEFAVGAPLPRSAVLPLGTTTIDGRTFPAPADPAAVLAAMYGPGWSVPDPGFAFSVPAATRERLSGWFGGYSSYRQEWSRWYGADAGRARGPGFEPDPSGPGEPVPSALARRLHADAPTDAYVVDLGCGAGDDALWLARSGRRVLGLDYAAPVASRAAARAAAGRLPATFRTLNLYDTRSALVQGALLARRREPVVVLARHLLDAVDVAGRRNALRLCRLALSGGGSAYLQVHARPPSRSPGPPVLPVSVVELTAEVTAEGGRVVALPADPGETTPGGGSPLTRSDSAGARRVLATWDPAST